MSRLLCTSDRCPAGQTIRRGKQAGHHFCFWILFERGNPRISANLSESRSVTRTLASLRLSRGIRQRSAERSTRASGTREMEEDSKVIFGCLIVCFMRAPEARVEHSAGRWRMPRAYSSEYARVWVTECDSLRFALMARAKGSSSEQARRAGDSWIPSLKYDWEMTHSLPE